MGNLWSTDRDYNVLLLGMTGTGKTSFLNFVSNYGILKEMEKSGIIPESPLEGVNILCAERAAEKDESQTDESTTYTIKGLLQGRNMRIIDCPGFGDTRGMLIDEQHVDKIVRSVADQRWVNTIMLMINGTQERIPTQLKYVLSRLSSVLVKQILSQTVVVYTNCKSAGQRNFVHKHLDKYFEVPIPLAHILHIDNPFSLMANISKPDVQADPEELDDLKVTIQASLKASLKGIDKLLTTVSVFPRVPAAYFKELHESVKKLEKGGVFMRQRLDEIEKQQKALDKLEFDLKKGGDEQKTLETALNAGSKEIRFVDLGTENNMICTKVGCIHNCHLNCAMPVMEDLTDLRKCECFSAVRTRKVRWSMRDAQQFLNKLGDTEFTVGAGAAEADEIEVVETAKPFLAVQFGEVLELESGQKLYGQAKNKIEPGDETWAWSKNFTTRTTFLDPATMQAMREASNCDEDRLENNPEPREFQPFDVTVRDCAHMEEGPSMKCSVCDHDLQFHKYQTYKREEQWVYDLGDAERKVKQDLLDALRTGERNLQDLSDVTTRAKERAEAEKAATIEGLKQMHAKFKQLASTTDYEKFLATQLEVLEIDEAQKLAEPDHEDKQLRINSLRQHKKLLIDQKNMCDLLGPELPPGSVDESAMQASMDVQSPADGIDVDAWLGARSSSQQDFEETHSDKALCEAEDKKKAAEAKEKADKDEVPLTQLPEAHERDSEAMRFLRRLCPSKLLVAVVVVLLALAMAYMWQEQAGPTAEGAVAQLLMESPAGPAAEGIVAQLRMESPADPAADGVVAQLLMESTAGQAAEGVVAPLLMESPATKPVGPPSQLQLRSAGLHARLQAMQGHAKAELEAQGLSSLWVILDKNKVEPGEWHELESTQVTDMAVATCGSSFNPIPGETLSSCSNNFRAEVRNFMKLVRRGKHLPLLPHWVIEWLLVFVPGAISGQVFLLLLVVIVIHTAVAMAPLVAKCVTGLKALLPRSVVAYAGQLNSWATQLSHANRYFGLITKYWQYIPFVVGCLKTVCGMQAAPAPRRRA